MLGMFGIIVQDDQVQNTVRITQEVKPGEKYMVQFLGDPTFARVCQVEEIQGWLLFQNQAAADNWLQKSVKQTAPTPPTPPEPPSDPPQTPAPEETIESAARAAAPHKLPPIEEQIPTLEELPLSDVPGDPDAQAN